AAECCDKVAPPHCAPSDRGSHPTIRRYVQRRKIGRSTSAVGQKRPRRSRPTGGTCPDCPESGRVPFACGPAIAQKRSLMSPVPRLLQIAADQKNESTAAAESPRRSPSTFLGFSSSAPTK